MHISASLVDLLNIANAGKVMIAQAVPAPPGEAGGAPAEGVAGFITSFFQNPINVLMLAAMLFFVIVLLPQQRQMKAKQKALDKALAELKKNDRVITASGIHGTVVQSNIDEAIVTVRIDENSGARMTINRDVIAKVIASDK